jgi:hypothetical protein
MEEGLRSCWMVVSMKNTEGWCHVRLIDVYVMLVDNALSDVLGK